MAKSWNNFIHRRAMKQKKKYTFLWSLLRHFLSFFFFPTNSLILLYFNKKWSQLICRIQPLVTDLRISLMNQLHSNLYILCVEIFFVLTLNCCQWFFKYVCQMIYNYGFILKTNIHYITHAVFLSWVIRKNLMFEHLILQALIHSSENSEQH